MSIVDNIRTRVLNWLYNDVDRAYNARVDFIMDRREYRMGMQKRFIKVRDRQADDNLIMNFISLAVDRGVSLLFGHGVEFDYGDNEDAQTFIDDVWQANDKAILLHKLGLYGSEAGHCFLKTAPQEDGTYKLVPIDPSSIDLNTDPNDLDHIMQYIIQYKTQDLEGKDVAYRQVIALQDNGTWLVTDYQASDRYSARWEKVGEQPWPYTFAPVVDWQNLPTIGDVWGTPDITEDVIELQDRINFVASNISKVIRLYAHPQRWGKLLGQQKDMTLGPDDMPVFNTEKAEINQLSPIADLANSHPFVQWLRQSLFDITRTVDTSSLADKLGALTDFGLRVVYKDALDKLATKRELYGDALREINRNLLELANMQADECVLVWPSSLPVNQNEDIQAYEADLRMGVVSKQTISEKRGYEWEDEKDRMGDEKQGEQNVGSFLLENFNKGL